MHDVHDTFARNIQVYGEPIHTMIDANSNPLYPYPQSASQEILSDSFQDIPARILFGKPAESVLTGGTVGHDSVITLPNGWARVKVDKQYTDIMMSSKRVAIDGSFFLFDSYPRPHGLFQGDYATFILRPINDK